MIFNDRTPIETTALLFNWGVDYNNGKYLTEYDLHTKEKNDFYSIQQNKILRFGLFGAEMKFYYETDGSFNINGKRIDIEYHSNGEVIHLTPSFADKQCITFKQAYTDYNNRQGEQKSNLESINFGYKTIIEKENVEIYFQPIVVLPIGGKAYMEIKLTSNTSMNGELVIKSKGKNIESMSAPLEEGYSGIAHWIIK